MKKILLISLTLVFSSSLLCKEVDYNSLSEEELLQRIMTSQKNIDKAKEKQVKLKERQKKAIKKTKDLQRLNKKLKKLSNTLSTN